MEYLYRFLDGRSELSYAKGQLDQMKKSKIGTIECVYHLFEDYNKNKKSYQSVLGKDGDEYGYILSSLKATEDIILDDDNREKALEEYPEEREEQIYQNFKAVHQFCWKNYRK